MNAAHLAEMITRYLEADDGGNGGSSSGNGSAVMTTSSLDSGARAQLQQLAQKTDQLQQDTAALKQNVNSLMNNIQMTTLLPLLMSEKLKVVSDTNVSAVGDITGDTLELQQADPLSALLPVLLLGGGLGGSGSGGDNSNNMLLLALAISGKI